MKSRLPLLLILLVVALVAAFFSPATRRLVQPNATPVQHSSTKPWETDANPFLDQDTTFAALRNRLLEGYRLHPDERYLGAIVEVARMSGRIATPTPDARFADGAWQVKCGPDSVATLSEFPSFAELESSLTRWARTCNERLGASAPAATGATTPEPAAANAAPNAPPKPGTNVPSAKGISGGPDAVWQRALAGLDPISALRVIDERWKNGDHGAPLLVGATRALTLLTMQSPDLVGTATPVAARALAALAMARASSAAPEREACLLADEMGYTAEARERAARLPTGDAVRLYVSHDDVALERSARDAEANYEARYLFLTRLCHGASLARWQKFYEQAFAANSSKADAALSTGLFVQDFAAAIPASGAVLASLEAELETRGFQRPGLVSTLIGHGLADEINEFERVIAKPPTNEAGTFLDMSLIVAHERSLFYSALWAYGDHMLYSLSSIDDTKWFSDAMGNPAPGPGREFQERFTHLADAKAGEAKYTDLEHDLATPSRFGGTMDLAAYDALGPWLNEMNPSVGHSVREFAGRLDSRPEARAHLAWALCSATKVLPQSEALFASVASSRGIDDGWSLGWYAHLAGDPDSLAHTLQRADFDALEWARVLTMAERDSTLAPDAIDRAFERALAQHPDDWSLVDAWAKRLVETKRFPRSREVLARWLSRPHEDSNWFQGTFARIGIARSFRKEGRFAEGLHEIGDLDQSYQFGTMSEKALLLSALDRDAEAESLAVRALRRYPDAADARILVMRMLWKGGRYDQAAAVMKESHWSLMTAEWARELVPAFRETFAGMPAEAVRAALALAPVGREGRPHVRAIANDFEKTGELDVAFQVHSRIPSTGGEHAMDMLDAYRVLKRSKGEAEALKWLNRHIPEGLRQATDELAWGIGLPELTWTFAPQDQPGAHGDYVWLLRAAAVAFGDRDPAHVQAVQAHLASGGNGSYYANIARGVMGMRSEAEVLRQMRAPKQRCEAYYFLGVKAEGEGRERDAAEWYAMSVATGLTSNGELHWASDRLTAWTNRERLLRSAPAVPAPVAAQGSKRPAGSS